MWFLCAKHCCNKGGKAGKQFWFPFISTSSCSSLSQLKYSAEGDVEAVWGRWAEMAFNNMPVEGSVCSA